MFERYGRYQSVVYEIEGSNSDVCQLHSLKSLYQIKTVTIRCLKNAPRIIYSDEAGFKKEQLVIEKCAIYWKDIQRLAHFGQHYQITELTLDDCEDEFFKGESDYFHHCLFGYCDGHTCTNVFSDHVTVHLLSSVHRPLSEAFKSNTWSYLKELSSKG